MAYYLGIDGGGSKTTCAVGDESSVLATATAGPSNITRVGEVRAREALQQAIQEACSAASIDPEQVRRACIGVAGAGRDEAADIIRRITAEIVVGEIEVVGDMQIALTAAFGEGPGVIVIAGTGSIAYGRDEQGKTARAGGWGFAISDEGSAHWIGRAAVSRLLRAIDEEKDPQSAVEASPLSRQLKAAWNVQSLGQLQRAANSNADFAALFPAVFAAAEAGDGLSKGVLTQAGIELARLAGTVPRRLFGPDGASLAAIPLAMAGGVFRHSPLVRRVFRDETCQLDSRIAVSPQIVEPVTGALQMARQECATPLKKK